MLKETGSISKKEAKEIRNAETKLKNEIEKLQNEKKDLATKLQQKEMEAAMANKKLQEMSELIKESEDFIFDIFRDQRGRRGED